MIYGIFSFDDRDAAEFKAALDRLHFPWDLLRPGMQAAGLQSIRVEFADLSTYHVFVDGNPDNDEVTDADGNVGHILLADRIPGLPHVSPTDAAAAPLFPAGEQPKALMVAGLAWHGKIQIDNSYRGTQYADDIVSSEMAHEVDFYYLYQNGMEPQLQALLPNNAAPHSWWTGLTSESYWDQPGESWMAGFGIAYTDFAQVDTRFTHVFTRAMVPDIRRILRADPTSGGINPPPPPPPPPAGPRITGFSPAAVSVGQVFEIDGTGFGTAGGLAVFSPGIAAPIDSWGDTTILCRVPAGAITGFIGVNVAGREAYSAQIVTITGGLPPPPPQPIDGTLTGTVGSRSLTGPVHLAPRADGQYDISGTVRTK